MEDSVRARIAHELMARVRRLLRTYGYPPDKQPAAIERVLKQAEDLAGAMA